LRRRLLSCALCLAAAGLAQQTSPSPVLQAMKAELGRSMEKLKSQPVPPYYLSYEITENQSASVSAQFGKITSSNEGRSRILDIDLRVGDYNLDNTREIRGARQPFGFTGTVLTPIENDADAIRAELWYQTDARYKSAVEQLINVKTNMTVKVEQEDKSGDFSREEPQTYFEPQVSVKVDRRVWEDKLRRYTAPFASFGDIYQASAYFTATAETRWYVNSEGASIQISKPSFRLSVNAQTKAGDGMVLPRYETFFSFAENSLPGDDAVLKAVHKMIADLEALRKAPLADPYTGPAILSGRATGVLFHEVFGHRVEGHRQKRETEGQTFKKMIGQNVLASGFSVYFDPTEKRAAGSDLSGFYLYDNQGVKTRRVDVVQDGVLKTFLMARIPIDGFPHSNGHGRKQPGFASVARQSNLIVSAAPAVTQPDLKKLLIEEVKKQGKPYGLYFEDIAGGFTITGRTIPNAFNVLPLTVYRIYPDGREELVRGVDLIGTPLTAFGKIAAADRNLGVFNGTCGAESGGVPVSAVSPGVYISQVETQKKEKSQERPPILPPPFPE